MKNNIYDKRKIKRQVRKLILSYSKAFFHKRKSERLKKFSLALKRESFTFPPTMDKNNLIVYLKQLKIEYIR